jgi:hypothetical protein
MSGFGGKRSTWRGEHVVAKSRDSTDPARLMLVVLVRDGMFFVMMT